MNGNSSDAPRLDELTHVTQSLQGQHAYLAGIIEIANEAIISTGVQQRITFFNKGAEQIFGYSRNEVLNQPLSLLLPSRLRSIHEEHISKFIDSQDVARHIGERQEIVGLRKNGEEFPAEASISKLDRDGQIILTVVLRDITKRRSAEMERERLIEALDAFTYTVAHDLKEPLKLITGYANLLKERARLPDELHQYLIAIARASAKMDTIIEELQLLAKTQHVEVELKPLHMARIVANVQQRLAYMIEESQAQIIMPGNWPTVLGYAPWVEAVWANYLSNAIKHGGQPPSIQLGATTRSENMVRFWVRDNGPGLTAKAQADLFKPFVQLRQVPNTGHGLGLSIVQRIVERLGGEVGVESEGIPGKGCIFYFTLPAVKK